MMQGQFKLKSRYAGPPEVARAFEQAAADLYESSHADIIGFEVCDEDGTVLGRFEGFVSLINATPEQFIAAVRRGR